MQTNITNLDKIIKYEGILVLDYATTVPLTDVTSDMTVNNASMVAGSSILFNSKISQGLTAVTIDITVFYLKTT